LSEDKEPPRKECPLCGRVISTEECICPSCGNVFIKDKDTWSWRFVDSARGTAGRQAKNHQASPTQGPGDGQPSLPVEPIASAISQAGEKLAEILNAYEHDRTRQKDGFMKDVILSHQSEEFDCFEMIDFSRSGTLSTNRPRQFVFTLKDGSIVGRGLYGKGPGEDDLEDSEQDIWHVWRVVWAEGHLRCLRCGYEWKPFEGVPEQCPACLGILSRPL
jgi:hypothetical protein